MSNKMSYDYVVHYKSHIILNYIIITHKVNLTTLFVLLRYNSKVKIYLYNFDLFYI